MARAVVLVGKIGPAFREQRTHGFHFEGATPKGANFEILGRATVEVVLGSSFSQNYGQTDQSRLNSKRKVLRRGRRDVLSNLLGAIDYDYCDEISGDYCANLPAYQAAQQENHYCCTAKRHAIERGADLFIHGQDCTQD